MRTTSVALWVLPLALLGSCSLDDNPQEARTQEEARQESAELAGHTDKVWYAAFSPDGTRIVTSSADSTARLWDREGKQLGVLEGDARSVLKAEFSPDGNRILAIADSADHSVRLWSSEGKQLAVIAGHTDEVRSAVFSPDGSRILTASADSTARLWDRDGKPIAVLAGHTNSVRSAEFNRGGGRILTTSADGTARLWNSEGNPLAVLEDEKILQARFSPDGSRVATIAESTDDVARLWDSEWKETAVLVGHNSSVRSVAFSPDGRRIVTGSADHTARVWDSEGKQLAVLEGHTAAVRLVLFSPDGSRVLTASDDGSDRLWNSDGRLLGVLSGYTGRLSHAEFSADGSRIVASSDDGTACLFPVRPATHEMLAGQHGIPATALLRYEHGYLPNGMYNSGVRCIFEDSSGHYWFGTWKDGVCRFDGEQLTYFTATDGLDRNQVRRVSEDRNGTIWFDTGDGICSYDGKRIVTHTDRDYSSKEDWQLGAEDIWFQQDDGRVENQLEGQPGVYRYAGEQLTFLAFPLPENRDTDWHYEVTGIARGKDGRIWFSTYGSVIGYDGESFSIINNQSLGLDGSAGSLHVRSIFEDSKGRVWIGNNGLGVLLHEGGTTVNFTQQNGLGSRENRQTGRLPGDVSDGSPALDRVFAIGEDAAGNIWFGTTGHGAWRYDGDSLRNFAEADGLASEGVSAIYTDRRGDLWLGGDGVYKFDGESFDRMH